MVSSQTCVGVVGLALLGMSCSTGVQNLISRGKSDATPAQLDVRSARTSVRGPGASPRAGVVSPAASVQTAQHWKTWGAGSCTFTLKVEQGTVGGVMRGRVAFSRTGQGRLRASIQGQLGATRCQARLTSLQDALLLERWDPTLGYATTIRQPRAQTRGFIESMLQLNQAMPRTLVELGCLGGWGLPPKGAVWTLQSAQASELRWSSAQGESQVLKLAAPAGVPVERSVHFLNEGQKTIWTIHQSCTVQSSDPARGPDKI